MSLLENTVHLYLEAAPWLLLGLVAAGLLKAWLPEGQIERLLGGRGLWSVTKGALVGAPLPLCSCGVLPAALGLRRGGASRGATLSFLVATPETGPDSIAVSFGLLGPFLAVVRPVAAVSSAILTGWLSEMHPQASPVTRPTPTVAESACCDGDTCHASEPSRSAPDGPIRRMSSGLRYALTDLLDDIALWLAIGLVVAGAVATYLPPMAIAQWSGGPALYLLMLVVGLPMYICATASTPVAAGLLMAGVSPGAVLVFLLAGPATNISTMGVVRRELGGSTLGTYLIGIGASAVLFGFLTDALVDAMGIDIAAELAGQSPWLPEWFAIASGVLLALFALRRLLVASPDESQRQRDP